MSISNRDLGLHSDSGVTVIWSTGARLSLTRKEFINTNTRTGFSKTVVGVIYDTFKGGIFQRITFEDPMGFNCDDLQEFAIDMQAHDYDGTVFVSLNGEYHFYGKSLKDTVDEFLHHLPKFKAVYYTDPKGERRYFNRSRPVTIEELLNLLPKPSPTEGEIEWNKLLKDATKKKEFYPKPQQPAAPTYDSYLENIPMNLKNLTVNLSDPITINEILNECIREALVVLESAFRKARKSEVGFGEAVLREWKTGVFVTALRTACCYYKDQIPKAVYEQFEMLWSTYNWLSPGTPSRNLFTTKFGMPVILESGKAWTLQMDEFISMCNGLWTRSESIDIMNMSPLEQESHDIQQTMYKLDGMVKEMIALVKQEESNLDSMKKLRVATEAALK